jgi:Ni2+-binding GTPase involved in maturation of urease and hydrogenase
VITFVPLSGFLGAGKTTTMVAAATALEQAGRRVAVVTNDQGVDLVDTALARAKIDAVGEVTGGCFCCKFDDLVDVVTRVVAERRADTVIAEAVGSCTDLHATVVRPLCQYYGDRFLVAPLTTVVEPLRYLAFARAWARGEPESDLSYLFRHQLSEADVIGVNKIDTVPQDRLNDILATLRAHVPEANVVPYSALTGEGLADLIKAWWNTIGALRDEDLDYDRYAAAEAQLAWLNQTVAVTASLPAGFVPAVWAIAALTALSERCAWDQLLIGHVKLTLETAAGLTKASVTAAGEAPALDLAVTQQVTSANAVFNARVACEPKVLDAAITAAVIAADDAASTTSGLGPSASFKPAYPRPVHRIRAPIT